MSESSQKQGTASPIMLRAARKELGLSTDETVVIGDTMETDILGGTQLEYKTILVLSGSTSNQDLRKYAYQPDLVVDSLGHLSHDMVQTELFELKYCAPADH